MTNESIINLDVSDLESPRPLHIILSTIKTNTENKTIIVLHRMEPFGLYPYLNKLGLSYSCQKRDHGFIITIWNKNEQL